MRHFILNDDHTIRPAGLMEWAEWFEDIETRRVARTKFECGVYVSTVFLGIDHRFGGKGPPLLFETMAFEMTMDGDGDECWRYSSWDDAVTGHAAAVRRIKAQLEKAKLSTVEIKDEVTE